MAEKPDVERGRLGVEITLSKPSKDQKYPDRSRAALPGHGRAGEEMKLWPVHGNL